MSNYFKHRYLSVSKKAQELEQENEQLKAEREQLKAEREQLLNSFANVAKGLQESAAARRLAEGRLELEQRENAELKRRLAIEEEDERFLSNTTDFSFKEDSEDEA